MKTLSINDLPRSEALDAKAMSAVQGGSGLPGYFSYTDLSSRDNSLKVGQSIGQTQEVFNANGNNVAFADDIHSTVKPTQTASNNVYRL